MKRELRIGIFVGSALVVMAVFIFIVGDLSLMFRKTGYTVTVDFDSAAGLESRTVVKMSGVKIGYIEDIKLAKRKARVTLSIFAGVEIPKDSKAAAASLGLLGEKFLDIVPGDAAESCQPGDALAAAPSFGRPDRRPAPVRGDRGLGGRPRGQGHPRPGHARQPESDD